MLRPGGYAIITMPDDMKETVVNFDGTRKEVVRNQHGRYEADTFSCFHCGAVEHVPHKPDVNDVGFCRNCMKPICKRCSSQPCKPFERAMEQAEASYHARRSYEI